VDDDGQVLQVEVVAYAFDQFEAVDVGQSEIDDSAVEMRRLQRLDGLATRAHAGDLHVVLFLTHEGSDAGALHLVVFYNEKRSHLPLGQVAQLTERFEDVFLRRRLGKLCDRAAPFLAREILFYRHDDNGNHAGVGGGGEALKHLHPVLVG